MAQYTLTLAKHSNTFRSALLIDQNKNSSYDSPSTDAVKPAEKNIG